MRKERKGLNVVDVVIILLVVGLLGTAGYRIYTDLSSGDPGKQSNITVTFEAEVENEGIVNYLPVGEVVYFTSNNTRLGNLYDANPDDGLGAVWVVGTNEYGKIILNGTLRLAADAYKAQDGGYYVIDDRNITVGGKIDVYTDKAVLNITVKGIEEVAQ